MSERVFLSFDHERDSARAAQWRAQALSSSTCSALDDSGLAGRDEWRRLERCGPAGVRHWIDAQLAATTVTIVLIGGETAASVWVRYTIVQSHARGRAMFGIDIHRLADPRTDLCDYKGVNPLDVSALGAFGSAQPLSELYPTYDWISDSGPLNPGAWISTAATRARRADGATRATKTPSGRLDGTPSCVSSKHVSETWLPTPFEPEP